MFHIITLVYNPKVIFVCLIFNLSPLLLHAQEPIKADTLIKKLDSLQLKADSIPQQNEIRASFYDEDTKLTPRSYFILLGSNIKQEFTKPFHMKKKDFANLGIFAVSTVAMSFADEPLQRKALALRNRSANVRNAGKFISNFGFQYEIITLAAFGAYGVVFKSTKVKTVTLLATQAVVTGAIVSTVLKNLSGRTRPNYYGPLEHAEPSFRGPFADLGNSPGGEGSNSAFPSGHATLAFAAATVFAVEYKNKPIIPIIAYSMATLVGVSRITENKHWATDVFAGAILGYLTGRQVAYNYHRYAKIKNEEIRKLKKNKVKLLLNYNFGRPMPGIVWKFN